MENPQSSALEKRFTNTLGQPIGTPLSDWRPASLPKKETMQGRFCRLEPLDPERHAKALYSANSLDAEGAMWTYLPYGPFETLGEYREWMQSACLTEDPLFFTIFDLTSDCAVGLASYAEISPKAGSIEVGHLAYSPLMRQTPVSTETMYLMMKNAFQLGYRRYQWRCNVLNASSRAAAQRIGLSFEGIFRQANVLKGYNRDTAWFAAVDEEWPAIRNAFSKWLSPDNFDENGIQKNRLSDLTEPILKKKFVP
ncbi:GNAT family protein [Leptospira ellisii]|uniref:GNAT family N-acetyltransferase n=1 Tax=Leptospira ellisii TaxID=2023197 RepID=A0A2N0B7D7_9LEPT|nr:GNAT family protein [Leptospira ellisii]MDV6235969.1 GNAT family protein [Leptospira ellisii]PJZ92465.1 GNAT family N-acetyltransferase [Leptospira ellisii]